MKNLKSTLVLLFILSIIAACGPQPQQDQSEEESTEAFDQKTAELKATITSIFDELPPATEIAARIQATGADFNGDLINDPALAEGYLQDTDGAKALNMGIYFTDLGYLTAYGQKDAALSQFQAARTLADNLGVGRALAQTVEMRFGEKIEQSEEAQSILNEAYSSANQNLRSGDRELVSAAAATGLFLESLYLLTSIVDTYPKDILPDDARNNILAPLVKTILERERTLDQLINLGEAVAPDTERADFFLQDLRDLKASFSKLNIQEQLENNRTDLVLNDETLKEVTEKVASIRARVTGS